MSLNRHPFNVFPETAEVRGNRNTCFAGLFPIADRPIQSLCFFPGNKRVTAKTCDVVAHRSVNRVLKINHARIAFLCEHQIARHEIPMNINIGLIQILRNNQREGTIKHASKLRSNFHPQMTLYEPLRKEFELRAKQFSRIRRKNIRFACGLKFNQGICRLPHQPIGVVMVQNIKISFGA